MTCEQHRQVERSPRGRFVVRVLLTPILLCALGRGAVAQYPPVEKAVVGGVTGAAVLFDESLRAAERAGVNEERLKKAILVEIVKAGLKAQSIDDLIQGSTDHFYVTYEVQPISKPATADAVFAVSVSVALKRTCRVIGAKRDARDVYCSVATETALMVGPSSRRFEQKAVGLARGILRRIQKANKK